MANAASGEKKITAAAAALKRLRPAYTELLSFYSRVFIAQENSKATIDLAPIQIPEHLLAMKRREALPLVNISEFVWDLTAGSALLKQLFEIVKIHHPALAAAAAVIESAATANSLSPQKLFQSLLDADDAFFEQTAHTLRADKNLLAFLAYHSIKPSLILCAEQLGHYLDNAPTWFKGYCPVCGSLPALAVLDHDGRRSLHCGFCWHEWPTRRIFCPFCDNTEASSLPYLYSEQEKELRADTCERCKKYIKTVDMRAADRTLYAQLENVASLHVDINAQERGYASGSETALQI